MLKTTRYCKTSAISLILAMGIAYLLIVPDKLHAQQSAISEEVIQKWKEFERFSQTIQGKKTVTFTSSSILQGKPQSYSDSYKQNRECALLSRSGTNASGVASTKFWTLANPRYAAEINTETSDVDKVLLKDYKSNSLMDPSGTGFSVSDHVFFEVAPHFTYWRTRLSQLVTKDSFKVKKVSKTSDNGHELVQLDFSFKDKKQQLETHGSLYLDPEQCWCIRRISESYVRGLNGTPFWRGEQTIEHQTITHPSGFPLIKRYVGQGYSYEGKEKKKAEGGQTIEYEWEINDHVPDSEFTLTAFGLPEPIDAPLEKPTPWYLWIMVAAVGCFAMALLFRYLRRRHQRRLA